MSQLARDYGIEGKRGNMIVREFLESNEIDLNQFQNPFINKDKVRRSILKMPGIIRVKIISKVTSNSKVA